MGYREEDLMNEALADLFAKKSRKVSDLARRQSFESAREYHDEAALVLTMWANHNPF